MIRTTAVAAMCVCALVLAGPVAAAEYDDTASGGDWDLAGTWDSTTASFPQTGDDVIIDSSTVRIPDGYTVKAVNSCEVRTGGTLEFGTQGAQDFPLTAAGGTLYANAPWWNGALLESSLNVDAGTSVMKALYGNHWNLAGGVVSGTTAPHTLKVQSPAEWTQGLSLTAASPTYSGQWLVEDGWLNAEVNGALGSGTVTLGGAGTTGRLLFHGTGASQTGVAGPAIHVLANGQVQVNASAVLDYSNDPLITLDGGSLYCFWTGTYKDPIHVASDSSLAPSSS